MGVAEILTRQSTRSREGVNRAETGDSLYRTSHHIICQGVLMFDFQIRMKDVDIPEKKIVIS